MTPKGAGRGPIVRFLPIALLVFVLILVLASGVWRHLSLDEIRDRRGALKAIVRLHPFVSVLAYVSLYAVVVALSIPGALIMTLSGGLLFGVVEGGAAAVAGVSLGAMAMFAAARIALGSRGGRPVSGGALLARIERGLVRHGFLYLLALRMMPAAPIWMVNLGASLVRIPFSTYAGATVLGVAPSCFIYAALGSNFDRLLSSGQPVSLNAALEPAVLGPLAALAVLALAPAGVVLVRARRGRRVAERGRVL